jgi:hypothetical protein
MVSISKSMSRIGTPSNFQKLDCRESINPLLNNALIPDKVLPESVLARAFAD